MNRKKAIVASWPREQNMVQLLTKAIDDFYMAPAAAPIDRDHLERVALGNRVLKCELLRLFDRQAEMLLARMRVVAPAAVSELAHTLKRSAHTVGAWNVAGAAEAVQQAGGAVAEIDAALNRLATVVHDAQWAIARLLSEQCSR